MYRSSVRTLYVDTPGVFTPATALRHVTPCAPAENCEPTHTEKIPQPRTPGKTAQSPAARRAGPPALSRPPEQTARRTGQKSCPSPAGTPHAWLVATATRTPKLAPVPTPNGQPSRQPHGPAPQAGPAAKHRPARAVLFVAFAARPARPPSPHPAPHTPCVPPAGHPVPAPAPASHDPYPQCTSPLRRTPSICNVRTTAPVSRISLRKNKPAALQRAAQGGGKQHEEVHLGRRRRLCSSGGFPCVAKTHGARRRSGAPVGERLAGSPHPRVACAAVLPRDRFRTAVPAPCEIGCTRSLWNGV